MLVLKVTNYEKSRFDDAKLLVAVSLNNLPDITSPETDLDKVLIIDLNYSDFISIVRDGTILNIRPTRPILPIDLYAAWRNTTWKIVRLYPMSGIFVLELA